MSQEHYLETKLDVFSMTECKPVSTPAKINLHLQPRENDKVSNFPFRQAIGSLDYLPVATRANISWIISKLSQHLQEPIDVHMTAVMRVLHYLQGTKLSKVIFKSTGGQLIAYKDSDWGIDPEDRRSTSDFIVILGSATISRKSRKQPTVALSSCETEYIALSEAEKEIIHYNRCILP